MYHIPSAVGSYRDDMRPIVKRLYPAFSENGVQGLLDYVEGSKLRLLTRLMLEVDARVIGIAQLARDLAAFEQQLNGKNVPEVAEDILDYLAIDLEANEKPAAFLQPECPVILMGINHESIIEPVILTALLERGDLILVGMKVFQYLGKRIAHYVLPVLPRRVAVDYPGEVQRSLSFQLNFTYQLYLMENKTTAEIEAMNKESLCKAAEQLCGGKALTLFPKGGHHGSHRWYQGIGELLSHIAPDLRSTIPIVPIATAGLTRNQVYWQAREAARGKARRQLMSVTQFDPIYLPGETADYDAAQLVTLLQRETEARQRKTTA